MKTGSLLFAIVLQSIHLGFARHDEERRQQPIVAYTEDEDLEMIPIAEEVPEITETFRYFYFGGEIASDLAEPLVYNANEAGLVEFRPFEAVVNSAAGTHRLTRVSALNDQTINQIVTLTPARLNNYGNVIDLNYEDIGTVGAILRFRGDSVEEFNKAEEWINVNGHYCNDIVLVPYTILPLTAEGAYIWPRIASEVQRLTTTHRANPRVASLTIDPTKPLHIQRVLSLIVLHFPPHTTDGATIEEVFEDADADDSP